MRLRNIMKLSLATIVLFGSASISASWLGTSSSVEYQDWSSKELKTWLDAHSIDVPDRASAEELKSLVESNWNSANVWTQDQYDSAQKAFADLRERMFETWDESQLRQFLLERGIVEPKGPREHLVLLAKTKQREYINAASSFERKASQTVAAYFSQATDEASGRLDATKDYIFSTWSDNDLKTYLVDQGFMPAHLEISRNDLLALMQDTYAKAVTPVWTAWSESYMREWLINHGLLREDDKTTPEAIKHHMAIYFYDPKDKVYDSWDDSTLKQWLIAHNIVAVEATLPHEKLLKLVKDNYNNVADTIWSAWSDWDLRQWLIQHGYIKSDAQKKRDELIQSMNKNYKDVAAARQAAYLTWPDARLRAFLREHGVSDASMPFSRPGLLQETRIRWVESEHRSEDLVHKIRNVINNSVKNVEDKLREVMDLVSGQPTPQNEL